MKTNGSEHEAVFAAAAHHLIAKRCYCDAIELLRACHKLAMPGNSAEQLLNKLNTVRDVCLRFFYNYPDLRGIQEPELAALRRTLRKLNQEFSNRLKRRGKKIKTLYDLLPSIEKHPAMYVGRPSLELLRIFLSECGNQQYKFTAKEWPSFGGFRAWVYRRYRKFQGGGRGWDQILIRAAGEDGPKALNLFFKELRQYRKAMA